MVAVISQKGQGEDKEPRSGIAAGRESGMGGQEREREREKYKLRWTKIDQIVGPGLEGRAERNRST